MSASSNDDAPQPDESPDVDDVALTRLLDRYEQQIRLVARMKLGSSLRRYLDSIDLAQSVHLALVRGIRDEKFDTSDPEKIVGLAVRMVRRKLARHLRRLYRRERIHFLLAESGALPAESEQSDRRDADPSANLEATDLLEQLLQGVDPADRRLLELRLEGYTTAEVARELGLDADVLRVRLSRLRKRLTIHKSLADWL